jgi:hypothetical protein
VAVTGLRPVKPCAAHVLIVHDDLAYQRAGTWAGPAEQRAGSGDRAGLAGVVQDHAGRGLGEYGGRPCDCFDVSAVHGELVEELDHAQSALGAGVDAGELGQQGAHVAHRSAA